MDMIKRNFDRASDRSETSQRDYKKERHLVRYELVQGNQDIWHLCQRLLLLPGRTFPRGSWESV